MLDEKRKVLQQLCEIILGDNYDVVVEIEKLDSNVNAQCSYNMKIPACYTISFDQSYLNECCTNDLSKTILHECFHAIVQPFEVILNRDDSINNGGFNHFIELSADASSMIAKNYSDQLKKIETLLLKMEN